MENDFIVNEDLKPVLGETFEEPLLGEDNNRPELIADSPQCCMTWRYYVAALGLLANCIISSSRMALSISLVNMTNSTAEVHDNTTWMNKTTMSCPVTSNSTHNSSNSQTEGEFNWSPQLQGFILGAGTLGEALAHVLGGYLSDTFGAKYILLCGNMLGAVAMLASPFSCSVHPYLMIAMQFTRGIGQGLSSPAIFRMITNWTPPEERGFISNLNFAGRPIGSVLGGIISGFLCEAPSLGWRSVFYSSGCVAILFSFLFVFTFFEKPEDHPWISKAELEYIAQDRVGKKRKKKSSIPWLKMFSSIKTYALMYAIFGQRWGVAYFNSVHPSYMGTILHYSIEKNGIVSSLPFLMVILGSLATSAFGDWLYRRNLISIDKLRKSCHFIGSLIYTLSMLGIYFAGCQASLNVAFLTTTLFGQGTMAAGSRTAIIDMAPNFAASLMGSISLLTNQAGVILPIIVGFMTHEKTMEQWQTVFLMNMGVMMSCGFFYLIFGSAEPQPWNFAEDDLAVEEKEPEPAGAVNQVVDS